MRKTPKKYYPPAIPADDKIKGLMEEKLRRILAIKYLSPGYVHWDISFFDVPKGEEDIRIVCNGTRNGLNEAVWVPSFYLPASVSLGCLLEPGTYQMDMDISEMFHNFVLNRDVRVYCRVNLTGLDMEEGAHRRNRWDRGWDLNRVRIMRLGI